MGFFFLSKLLLYKHLNVFSRKMKMKYIYNHVNMIEMIRRVFRSQSKNQGGKKCESLSNLRYFLFWWQKTFRTKPKTYIHNLIISFYPSIVKKAHLHTNIKYTHRERQIHVVSECVTKRKIHQNDKVEKDIVLWVKLWRNNKWIWHGHFRYID